jgi:CelD/BcsL family acetyltransferase involved in cellulose biosynthesis
VLPGPSDGVRSMKVDVVADRNTFDRLHGEWDRLVSTGPSPNLCLTHEWLAAWWEAFDRREGRVALFVAREGEQAVAAVPLQRHRVRVAGIPVRGLEFAANLHTFRLDFVFPGEREIESLVAALLDCALHRGARPDVLFFKDLPSGSPTVAALERFAERRGFRVGRENERLSSYVVADGDWEAYFRGLSKGFRSSLRRIRKRAREAGVTFERVGDDPRATGLLDEGLALEAAGWKGRGGTAILASPEETSFYRGLARRLEGTGRLEQYAMRLGNRLIGWQLSVIHAGACYALKTAYAEDQASLSPGFAVQMVMMEHLFQAPEVCIYDMLPPAVEFKRRWSREGIEQVSLRLYAPTARGRLAHLLQGRLRPALRRSALLRRAKRRVLGD